MWLDKFSNQSTPAGGSTPARAYSPSPRKAAHLGSQLRNGLGLASARSTSTLDLTLSPASSNLSLPLPTKSLNGSGLKQEQKPPADVPDPLIVLRDILGTKEQESNLVKEPKLKQRDKDIDIDFDGLSLQDYVSRDKKLPNRPQTALNTASATRASRQRYKDFHESIIECDDTLQSVEVYLNRFKAELGQVSAEIESLQAKSVQLNAQLDNRRKVEKILGPAVESLSLSPATVRAVAEGPIDDTFGKALTEIEARHLTITTKHKDAESTKALEDIQPLLENLKARAVERIRDYLVAQIKSIRSPNINVQIIQQRSFLRHKELYPFLARNNPVLADEIGQAYVNTLRWYYTSNFARYRTALEKLQIYPFDQSELLGSDPTAVKRSALTGSKGSQPQHDPFSIGRRAEVLKAKTDAAIPSHLAEDSKIFHHLEIPFRHFNQALLDNVSAEYAIVTELFSSHSYQQVSRRVNEIFEPTFSLGHELTKMLVDNSTDALGILMCVRLNQHFAFETQRRKVPVLDSYTNYTNILLWPRLQKIMDLHQDSLKKVSVPSNRGAVAAFSLVGGGGGGSDSSSASIAPHSITQRFGQFLHSVLTLSADAGDDEPVANSLSRLRTEYETLLGKLAKGSGPGSGGGDQDRRKRFMYNNFSLVLTIIGDTRGKLAEEQKEHFGSLMRDHSSSVGVVRQR